MPERSPEAKARRVERARERYRAQNARGRALTAMSRLYPDDYAALMEKEMRS